MSLGTINKHIIRVSQLLRWATRHGHIHKNYASGLRLKDPKVARDERTVFSQEQLRCIFSTDIYTLNHWQRPYQFWLPAIALQSGMRLEEIAQLHLTDVREVDGVFVFDVNDQGTKHLKTPSSRRLVPVHPMLISAGLLQFVEVLREKGGTRLFPELPRKRDGFGSNASRWFARYRKRLGITSAGVSPAPCFHSFRHSFATALREAGVSFQSISDLLGHSSTNTTARYAKKMSIVKYAEEITRLDFGAYFTDIKFNINKM